MFEGTLNVGLLVEYVRKCLAPILGDDVVVWDNSAVHKSKLVAQALKACGVRVVCLPPFSLILILSSCCGLILRLG